MAEAVAAHQAGDLDTAERRYRAILKTAPRNADALNLLGVVALQRGRPADAVPLMRRAIALSPAQPGYHNNLGEALRAAGDLHGAESAYREALRQAPRFAQAWGNLALCQVVSAQADAAAHSAAQALALAPDAPEAHNVMGLAEQARGNAAQAVDAFRTALSLAPGNPKLLANLADALRATGDHAGAADACRQLSQAAPGQPRVWWMLAENLRAAGDTAGAVQAARQAVQLAPEALEARLSLEAALRAEGRIAEGVECLREALRIAPDRAATHNDLGMSLMALGESEEARRCFERALELDPALAPAWENLARSGRFAVADAGPLAIRAEQRLEQTPPEAPAVPHLHFAAALWRDAAGDTERAVQHYRLANRTARALRCWDADAHSALVDRLVEVFDASLFVDAASPPGGGEGSLPLLVVGMPRSGTSLVEQVLASHPRVQGAGELNLLAGYTQRMPAMLGDLPWPECARALDAAKRADLAAAYCSRLRSLAPDAARVTDKMPSNFLHLGLLALMLPDARVVACVRDPRDVAVSVLMHHFEGGHEWAYDAYEIGRYQADHDRLMAHWKQVLPLDMHEVVYEDLVETPEAGIRALVAWAGLPWHDGCLQFHRTRRVVRTASQSQVREPINRRSVGRSRRYAALLAGHAAGMARAPRQSEDGTATA